jgi:hypothetical protein
VQRATCNIDVVVHRTTRTHVSTGNALSGLSAGQGYGEYCEFWAGPNKPIAPTKVKAKKTKDSDEMVEAVRSEAP